MLPKKKTTTHFHLRAVPHLISTQDQAESDECVLQAQDETLHATCAV